MLFIKCLFNVTYNLTKVLVNVTSVFVFKTINLCSIMGVHTKLAIDKLSKGTK